MSQKSNHTREFSKRAISYQNSNIIQKEVAKYLISKIKHKPKTILDLGAGNGAVYDLIDWDIEKFVAIDLAKDLLDLHPQNENIEKFNADFDDENLYRDLGMFEITISSSALQWSKDLPKTLDHISNHTKYIAFAIFCDKTFKTIREVANLDTFLKPTNKLLDHIKRYFDVKSEVIEYKLYFDDNISKFRYIKNSGVSGGKKILNYKDTKYLIQNYPLDYLEFEVLFVWGKIKER